jgi:threonyl-tRNA synthetase
MLMAVQFHQDDAHIFCTEAQIQSEVRRANACIPCSHIHEQVQSVLRFVQEVYGLFGLSPIRSYMVVTIV